jgi:hypothetical protein
MVLMGLSVWQEKLVLETTSIQSFRDTLPLKKKREVVILSRVHILQDTQAQAAFKKNKINNRQL